MKKLLTLTLLIFASSPLLASCLLKKSGNYSKNNSYPYLEIWNKEKPGKTDYSQAFHIKVGQNLATLQEEKPFLMQPGFRLFGWAVEKNSANTITKDFDVVDAPLKAAKPVYIAVYKNTAKNNLDYPSLRVYEISPNTTVYLSWTKDKSLYPQTGQLGGLKIVGYTESCLDLGKNVKTLKDVTKQARAAMTQGLAPSEAERKAQEAIAKKKAQQAKLEADLEKTRKALEKKQAEAKKQQVAERGRSASEAVSEYLKEIKLSPEVSKELFPKQYTSSSDYKKASNWYAIVGAPVNAELKDVERAYKARVKQFHPDKAKDKLLAQEVTKVINDAYAKIKKVKETENKK